MIYLVRHRETDWNILGRYQSRIDIESNQKDLIKQKKFNIT